MTDGSITQFKKVSSSRDRGVKLIDIHDIQQKQGSTSSPYLQIEALKSFEKMFSLENPSKNAIPELRILNLFF